MAAGTTMHITVILPFKRGNNDFVHHAKIFLVYLNAIQLSPRRHPHKILGRW